MLPSKRVKQTFYIIKRHAPKVGSQVVQQYDAEEEPAIKYEEYSEIEPEHDILATTSEPHHSELVMTCSDNEDSCGTSTGWPASESSHTTKHPKSAEMKIDSNEGKMVASTMNAIPSKEPSLANVLNILTSLAEDVKDMQGKTDSIQKEVASISNRLTRVERKVGISLATMEQVKDVIVAVDNSEANETGQAEPRFTFKAISNEDELIEVEAKLGNDEEYYAKVKRWINQQIHDNDPYHRLHVAMDLVFERAFLPNCSWSGLRGTGPKIPIKTRTNILKLFADIGSNQYITVNQLFVQRFFLKKLPHAKIRFLRMGENSQTS